MIINRKAIPRRTVLRGMGTTLALPFLDAMVPALASAQEAARPTRLATVYLPNGTMMDRWTPTAEGANFELTPILSEIAAHRENMLVITGLAHNEGGRAWPGENTGDHARAGASYLSGVHPKKTEGADVEAGTTMDQIAARHIGADTQFSSMELCMDTPELLGQCEAGYTCAYMNTISWRTPTTPLPMEDRPRVVFERLFGDNENTTPEVRLRQLSQERSILDSISAKAARLNADLGRGDQHKMTEYLDAIRDVERRIAAAEAHSNDELPTLHRPAGIPETFTEHAKMMFDLQVLAFQTDLTRVSTFMIGREFGGRTYREIDIPEGHHALTHHQYRPEKIAKVIRINHYHAQHTKYFLDRLAATEDGDGSLLDHSMVLYGGGISDGNSHLHDNLPTVLFGGAAGKLKGGRHLRFPPDTPMTNLYLAMLDMLGVHEESLGDSTGHLDLDAPQTASL